MNQLNIKNNSYFDGKGGKFLGSCPIDQYVCGADGVYTIDFTDKAEQIKDLTSRGYGRTFTGGHTEVFCAGKPYNLSCYPKDGFLKIKDVAEGFSCPEHGVPYPEMVGKLDKGFYYEDDAPKAWSSTSQLWLFGYWGFDWAASYEKPETLDTESGFLSTAAPYGHYFFRKGQRFRFVNVIDDLLPGEFAVDKGNGKICFVPKEGDDLTDITVSVQEHFLVLDGLENVVIENCDISEYTSDAIVVRNCRNITIRNCNISNVGGHAVYVEDSYGVLIENCEISHTGEGCVYIKGGDVMTLTPGNSGVRNCHIHDIAYWARLYAPAIYLGGCGLFAENNIIHDGPHTAILYQGNNICMCGNVIYDVLYETNDAGAIYSGRNLCWRGNVISGNLLFRISGYGSDSMGVYNDDTLSGTIITNNVFWKIKNAIFCGGGRDFEIHNNIFVDCMPAIRIDNRGSNPSQQWRGCTKQASDTFRKIFADPDRAALYLDAYPALKEWQQIVPEEGAAWFKSSGKVSGNICCGGDWMAVSGWCPPDHEFEIEGNQMLFIEDIIAMLPDYMRDVLAREGEL